jgi:rod shape-determining protein MreC
VDALFRLLGNKKLILLLACLILFIALMGLTLNDDGRMSWPEKFVKDTVSYGQSLIYIPIAKMSEFVSNLASLHLLYEENAALKSKLMDYARDTARLNQLEEQVARLEEALAFTERQKKQNRYIWHYADVVSASPDPNVPTININKGELDGIRVNMAVATTDGLIGRVASVAPFYSTVQLISAIDYHDDASKAIAATVKGKPDSFGMIERMTKDGYLEMNKIPATDLLEVGDVVITSGYGGVYPHGIEIGRVVSRRVGDFGITHTALIEPFANLNGEQLRQVFVIEVPEP